MLPWVLSRFLNNINGTKSRKKSQMVNEYKELTGNHEQMSVNKKEDFYVKDFTASVSSGHFVKYILK